MALPVIRYPGAKWRFYEHIKPYISRDTKVWIEPFFGGGSMSLSIADDPDFKLERMIGGDLAPEIWAMWTGIRNNSQAVVEISKQWLLQGIPHLKELQNLGIDTDMMIKYTGEKAENFETSEKLSDFQKGTIRNNLSLFSIVMEEAKLLWKQCAEIDCSQLSIEQRAARTFLVNKLSFSGIGDSGSLSRNKVCDFKD